MTSEIFRDFYNTYEGRFFTNGIITFKPTSISTLPNGRTVVCGWGNKGSDNYLVDFDDLKANFRKVVC